MGTCGQSLPGHPEVICGRHEGHEHERGDLGHLQSMAQGGARWPSSPAQGACVAAKNAFLAAVEASFLVDARAKRDKRLTHEMFAALDAEADARETFRLAWIAAHPEGV